MTSLTWRPPVHFELYDIPLTWRALSTRPWPTWESRLHGAGPYPIHKVPRQVGPQGRCRSHVYSHFQLNSSRCAADADSSIFSSTEAVTAAGCPSNIPTACLSHAQVSCHPALQLTVVP